MSLSGRRLKVHCRSNPVEMIPSREDIATTRRLKEAGSLLGICVEDHIIVDTDSGDNRSVTNKNFKMFSPLDQPLLLFFVILVAIIYTNHAFLDVIQDGIDNFIRTAEL